MASTKCACAALRVAGRSAQPQIQANTQLTPPHGSRGGLWRKDSAELRTPRDNAINALGSAHRFSSNNKMGLNRQMRSARGLQRAHFVGEPASRLGAAKEDAVTAEEKEFPFLAFFNESVSAR